MNNMSHLFEMDFSLALPFSSSERRENPETEIREGKFFF